MGLFCPSLPTRLLIPARDQSFQRESDPHMMHIIHRDWQTLKSCRALQPAVNFIYRCCGTKRSICVAAGETKKKKQGNVKI